MCLHLFLAWEHRFLVAAVSCPTLRACQLALWLAPTDHARTLPTTSLRSENCPVLLRAFAPTALRGRRCRPCGRTYRASRAGRPTRYSALVGRLPAAPRALGQMAFYCALTSFERPSINASFEGHLPDRGRGRGTVVPPRTGRCWGTSHLAVCPVRGSP